MVGCGDITLSLTDHLELKADASSWARNRGILLLETALRGNELCGMLIVG